MTYRYIRGEFVVRYADDGCGGPQPDGDTARFHPDNPDLVRTLERFGGSGPDFKREDGVNLRFEAIDALETHFQGRNQNEALGDGARDLLLAELGFDDLTFCDNGAVSAANPERVRGAILANGIDQHGRIVAFAYAAAHADLAGIDGIELFVEPAHLDDSLNARLLDAGLVYPAFFDSLPAELRDHLAPRSRRARADGRGLWASAVGHPGAPPAVIGTLDEIEDLVIVPVMFRRLVPFRNSPEGAVTNGVAFWEDWLRAEPGRDEAIMLLPAAAPLIDLDSGQAVLQTGEIGNLHDILVANPADDTLRLTVNPEDYVRIDLPTGPSQPPTMETGRSALVRIVAALPNPAGADRGAETVTLLNLTAEPISVDGWAITDALGSRFDELTGEIGPGDARRVDLTTVQLGNTGDTVILVDGERRPIDRATYRGADARSGATVVLAG
ncbi:MAG: hypothetical protein S0880_07770 [Actinomycetota bacterium]|nr:hypothetical protein [Actinomycetota bacterium]